MEDTTKPATFTVSFDVTPSDTNDPLRDPITRVRHRIRCPGPFHPIGCPHGKDLLIGACIACGMALAGAPHGVEQGSKLGGTPEYSRPGHVVQHVHTHPEQFRTDDPRHPDWEQSTSDYAHTVQIPRGITVRPDGSIEFV